MGKSKSPTAKPQRSPRSKKPAEPFDAIAKQAVRADPWAIVKLLGLSTQGVRIQAYPVDVKTIRREGDAAFVMEAKDSGEDGADLFTMEIQSGYKEDVEPRMALTRAAFKVDRAKSRRPWRRLISVLILLRPEADRPGRPYDGHYCDEDVAGASAGGEMSRGELFYKLIRLWRWDAVDMPAMGPGLALLAIFGKMTDVEAELPVVVKRVRAALEKARREGTMNLEMCEAGYETMAATMSRMFPKELVMSTLNEVRFYETPRGVRFLRDFAKYQAKLEREKGKAEGKAEGEAKGKAEGEAKGEATGVRRSLLMVGAERLGRAPKSIQTRLNKIDSIDALNAMLKRVGTAGSWRELLGS